MRIIKLLSCVCTIVLLASCTTSKVGLELEKKMAELANAKLPIEKVVKALFPFFGALLLVLMAVTYIPALSLWLPGMLLK